MDLCVPLAGLKSLEASLASCYCYAEQLTTPNQYSCSSCKQLSDATKVATEKKMMKMRNGWDKRWKEGC